MALPVIEINDCELRAGKESFVLLRSPGYAVLEDDRVTLGKDAFERARLNPRRSHNRYWHLLNQDSLVNQTSQHRHHADLVYAHLSAIHQQIGLPPEVIFAVPGSYTSGQLSMLLGIAEACGCKAVGLVDSAVAAAARSRAKGEVVYVDLHLHATTITRVRIDHNVERISQEAVHDFGQSKFYDLCAAQIADCFIHQCRFDPLHQAETEQALYTQLPSWLAAAQQGNESSLEIVYAGSRYSARLEIAALKQALVDFYRAIVSRLNLPERCLLSDRFLNWPGFFGYFDDYRVVQMESLLASCDENEQAIVSTSPDIKFVTRLPCRPGTLIVAESRDQEALASGGTVGPIASHVLSGYRAYAISDQPLYFAADGSVSRDKTAASAVSISAGEGCAAIQCEGSESVYLGNRPIEARTAVQPGDNVRIGESPLVFTLIATIDADAP